MFQAQVQGIAARVKICLLKTGMARFQRTHKRETADVAQRHHTDIAKVQANHIKGVTEWEAIGKLQTEAKTYHDSVTRPTVDDGVRLMPLGREFEHSQKMSDFQSQHRRLVRDFMAMYPDLRAQAPIIHNGLHDDKAWPEPHIVEAKFKLLVEYRPCPTEGEWADWLSVSATAAQAELTDQLEQAIRRVAERCAAQGPLYATVFSNLKELLDLVPDLNLTNDPFIAKIAADAKKLTAYRKDEVANSDYCRQQLAEEANRLASMFAPSFLAQAS